MAFSLEGQLRQACHHLETLDTVQMLPKTQMHNGPLACAAFSIL